MTDFLTFNHLHNAAVSHIGSKGLNLARLKHAAFQVPDGGVLTTNAFETCLQHDTQLHAKVTQLRDHNTAHATILKLAEEITSGICQWTLPAEITTSIVSAMEALIQQGYPSVAVRSSSLLEDTQDHSFAGQYESFLEIHDADKLVQAVLKCWASAFDSKVIHYCLNRNIALKKLVPAVVIQGLIESEISGVLFTIDPVSGDDCTLVINAATGLGEALVQGEITPQHYHYNWFTEQHIPVTTATEDHTTKPLLSTQHITTLSKLALDIQTFYGCPQDIEWCFYNGQFYILQARPIVAIHYATPYEWSNADFKDGGVASSIPTPLMWSLYEKIFESTMPDFLRKVGLHPKQTIHNWTQRFMGFPYWNLSAVKAGAKKIPGFVERQFEADLGIETSHATDGHITRYTPKSIITALGILFRINRSIRHRLNNARKTQRTLSATLHILEQQTLSSLTDDELANWSEILVKSHHQKIEGEYFNTIYDNSNGATLFKDALRSYRRKANKAIDELHLISGLDQVSHLQPVNDLWQLSRHCLSSPDELEKLNRETATSLCEKFQQQQDYPFAKALNAYIKKYQHHSQRELDLLVECWDENPLPVFQSLFSMLAQDDQRTPQWQQQKQQDQFQQEFTKIRSTRLKRKLITHRALLILREDIRDLSTRMYRLIRRAFLEMGQRLEHTHKITSAEDLFFLDYTTALQLFRTPDDSTIITALQKNRQHYLSFRNFPKPNEIFSQQRPNTQPTAQISQNSQILKGIASSPGIIEGEIWVQEGTDITTNIKPGSILVAPYTDPSYTLLFSSITGLITETGGILSHGAVVSREYGIPAVLAVKNACATLKTGMRVRIDGHNGEVCILNE